MYRIAICDDERDYLEIIENKIRVYCRQQEISIVIKLYDDSDQLVEDIEENKQFDVYILDIEMKVYTGIEIARIIEAYSNAACIIFLTAYQDYAIQACGMNIFRYVLKDDLKKEFVNVMSDLFQRLEYLKNPRTYIISNQRRYIKLFQRDIIYIYKDQKNIVFILMGKKTVRERTTLQEAYKNLDKNEMFFLDRGVIINLFHVRKIIEETVTMEEGHSILSSSNRIMELKRFLSSYWGKVI